MKKLLVLLCLSVLVCAAFASAAERQKAIVLFTPPLGNVDSFVTNTFEVSFVSTGSAQIELTIQTCTLAGSCTSAGFVCVNVPLTYGKGCSTGNLAVNEPIYAKFIIRKKGSGAVDGLGSLRVIGPDGSNSAAVQTGASGLEKFQTEQ